MPNLYLKPLFWNTKNYTRPSGVRASSGYPREFGFGHEEWNNSDSVKFVENGTSYRAFHTQPFGTAELPEGSTFIFFIAAHDGVQQLLGIAGDATYLADNLNKRKLLAGKIDTGDFKDEAWEVQRVKDCFRDNYEKFTAAWNQDDSWLPNWFCTQDMFLWLNEPVTLDPQKITGKRKLVMMYNRYSQLDTLQAQFIMNHVPETERSKAWHNIHSAIVYPGNESLLGDIAQVERRRDIPKTTREQLIKTRLGQGKFREKLLDRWDSKCAVTGCGLKEILRASHIKPWSTSDDNERLDPSNGLLLAAHIDALFDRGKISFDDSGEMLVSSTISQLERKLLGIPSGLNKTLSIAERGYLSSHRSTNNFTK